MSVRLGIRTRLLVACVLAVAAALTVLVGAFTLLLRHELESSAGDRARARATAELAAIQVGPGGMRVSEAPDSAAAEIPVWVFSGSSVIERPHVSRRLDDAAARLTTSGDHSSLLDAPASHLYAVPVESHGRRLGTVVAAVSLAPYHDTERAALLLSIAVALVLLAVVTVAARTILGRALSPVAEMTAAAAIWSDHDLARRFPAAHAQDEIGRLATTLNALLDRVAEAIRREQLFTAEISHELRTPLSRIRTEVELALRRPRDADDYRSALTTVGRNAVLLTRIVDTLLDATRAEAGQPRGSADAMQVARDAVAACAPIATRSGMRLHIGGSTDARVAVDADLGARILQPVVENACYYGRSHAGVHVSATEGSVAYDVVDDGSGVGSDDISAIFEPGWRGATNDEHPAGAGLGLALARRLAHAVGGTLTPQPGAGGRFRVTVPRVGGDPIHPETRPAGPFQQLEQAPIPGQRITTGDHTARR